MDLTKAEEEIMQILWKLEKGFVKEVIEEMPAPKPAYNTVSTIIRILEKKGFVGYEAHGRSHRYFPLISKSEYSDKQLKSMVKGYFGGSFHQLVSFFVKENKLDPKEKEEILKYLSDDDAS